MAAIGELFKTLGKNEVLENYCKEMENGASNNEILEEALNNEELMTLLRNIINDDSVIKNKMDVIIGQKRKAFEKNQQKELYESTQFNQSNNKQHKNEKVEDKIDEEDEDVFIPTVISRPFNEDKAVWLGNWAFIEVVDHRTRMVTTDFECYY